MLRRNDSDKDKIAIVASLSRIGADLQDIGPILGDPQVFKNFLYVLKPLGTGKLPSLLLKSDMIYHFMILIEYLGTDERRLGNILFQMAGTFNMSVAMKYNSEEFKNRIWDVIKDVVFHSELAVNDVVKNSLIYMKDSSNATLDDRVSA